MRRPRQGPVAALSLVIIRHCREVLTTGGMAAGVWGCWWGQRWRLRSLQWSSGTNWERLRSGQVTHGARLAMANPLPPVIVRHWQGETQWSQFYCVSCVANVAVVLIFLYCHPVPLGLPYPSPDCVQLVQAQGASPKGKHWPSKKKTTKTTAMRSTYLNLLLCNDL